MLRFCRRHTPSTIVDVVVVVPETSTSSSCCSHSTPPPPPPPTLLLWRHRRWPPPAITWRTCWWTSARDRSAPSRRTCCWCSSRATTRCCGASSPASSAASSTSWWVRIATVRLSVFVACRRPCDRVCVIIVTSMCWSNSYMIVTTSKALLMIVFFSEKDIHVLRLLTGSKRRLLCQWLFILLVECAIFRLRIILPIHSVSQFRT